MIGMFRQVFGIAVMCFKGIQRQPLWIVQSIMAASGLTLALFAWGSTHALENLVLAYFIAGSWALGLNLVGQTIGWERVYHVYDSNVASSITLPIYFLGLVMGHLPYFLVNVTMSIVIAIIVGMGLLSLLPLLLVSVVSTILGAFLALSAILRLKNPTNISSITNPLVTLTTILPPVYYPLYFLPPLVREASLAMPTVSLMEVARLVTNTPATCNPILSIASLLSWLTICTVLVLRKLKWGSQ